MAKITDPTEDKKCDIFISYCHDNEAEVLLAHNIYERLTRDEYSAFLDTESRESGKFPPQLEQKIKECTDFIIIVGEHSFDKPTRWYCKELKIALDNGKHIMPVLKGIKDFSDCWSNIPDELNGITENRKFVYPDDQELHIQFYKNLIEFLHTKNIDKGIIGPSYESYEFKRTSKSIREFFWYVAGVNIDILQLCPSCHVRYALIGTLVCLTAALALFTGGYALYSVTESIVGVLVAPIYAYFIFTIDRTFVVGGDIGVPPTWAKWCKFGIRFVLAILIGVIISAPFELLIFHGKIDEYVAKNHEDVATEIRAKNDWTERKDAIQKQLNELDKTYKEKEKAKNEAQTKVKEEVDEGKYSGKSNEGPVSRKLQREADELSRDFIDFSQNYYPTHRKMLLDELQRIATDEAQKEKSVAAIKNKDDLITRYYAFSSLTDSDGTMRFVAWIIRILFIVFEIVPILSKALMSDKNEYEELRAKIEEIKRPIYENVTRKIHERMFGEAFDKKSTGKFEQLSGFMEEEYHKAQLMNKGLNDLNHFWRYNGYK